MIIDQLNDNEPSLGPFKLALCKWLLFCIESTQANIGSLVSHLEFRVHIAPWGTLLDNPSGKVPGRHNQAHNLQSMISGILWQL